MSQSLIKRATDRLEIFHPNKAKRRSGKWPRTRNAFVKVNPECAACGREKKLQVHHVVPFSQDPSLELQVSNMITLCMGFTSCHSSLGHWGSWASWNINVRHDAAWYRRKVDNRP